MSYDATRAVWDYTRKRDDLSSAELLVLLDLADRQNPQTAQLNPSIKRMADDCHCSEATIKRAVVRLTELGLIRVTSGGGRVANRYVLVIPTVAQSELAQSERGSSVNPQVARDDARDSSPRATNKQRTFEKEPAPNRGADLRLVVSKQPDYDPAAAAMHEVTSHFRKKWGMPA